MTLPDAKAQKLIDGGYLDKEVVLGIRPEDIHDQQLFLESSPDSVVDAEIAVTEMLGSEINLYFTVDNFDMTAIVDPRCKAKAGDVIKLALDLNKVHVFDKDTEMVITN